MACSLAPFKKYLIYIGYTCGTTLLMEIAYSAFFKLWFHRNLHGSLWFFCGEFQNQCRQTFYLHICL